MTGERFGSRVVVEMAEPGPRGKPRVLVRCDCGAESERYLADLRAGRSKSCRMCAQAKRSRIREVTRCPNCEEPVFVDEIDGHDCRS